MVSLVNYPTDELVAIGWLGSIPGLSPAMVATQLPADADKAGKPAPWVATGFIVVAIVGGSPDPDLPIQSPVVQVDCYATVPGSNKPPWWFANRLATTIVRASRSRTAIPRGLTLTSGPVSYGTAAVQRAAVLSTPRRVYDDVGDYARYQFDLGLTWISVGERLD